MLTKRYLTSVKNLPAVLQKITEGTAPSNFSADHLKAIGFGSSNDRAIVPLLKELGFLSDSGAPTERYHAYRAGGEASKAILGQAVLETYEDLFHINANPTDKDRAAIKGRFKSDHNVSDEVAEKQTATFFCLLNLADLKKAREGGAGVKKVELPPESPDSGNTEKAGKSLAPGSVVQLRHNIEIHLPATKDIEVYNAIFKSLREHIID